MDNTTRMPVKTIVGIMSDQLNRWNRHNSLPTYPELANFIEAQRRSLGNIAAQKSMVSPSMIEAVSYIENAWNNRDNRARAVKYLNSALDHLRRVDADFTKTDFVPKYERRTIESISGYSNSSRSIKSVAQDEIDDLKRVIRSYSKGGASACDEYDIADVEARVRGMEHDYAASHRMKGLFARAISSLSSAKVSFPDNDQVKSYLHSALKEVEAIEQQAQIEQEPADLSPVMTPDDTQEALDMIDETNGGILSDFNAYDFNPPAETVQKIYRKARDFRNFVKRFDSYTALRMAEDMVDNLSDAAQAAKGMDATWKTKAVSAPFQIAWNKAIEIRDYLRQSKR